MAALSPPPAGSVADPRYAEQIPILGSPTSQQDSAFAPPGSPLGPGTAAGAQIVYRDLPIVTIATNWGVSDVQAALNANMIGVFDQPAQLCDAILGDDRVQATLGSRISGLLGRETIFEPADDSDAAREVCDAFESCWDGVGGYGSLGWMIAYQILAGWSIAQITWDTTGPIWKPILRPWHQRFSYYHWNLRRYVALSQDGQIAVEPGNGKWVLHAPWGEYRAWVFGCLRAVAQPWLIRNFAYRDWARFSEVHGIPIKKALCPASADPTQRAAFESSLSQLPNETTILLARGMEGQGSDYDLELLEARDTAWESFPGLIDRCDMSIVLSILYQNLTTEVQGGSRAATVSHMDIRQAGIERDDLAVQATIPQIARPFAFVNFGDADLAPRVRYDVQSSAVHRDNATLAAELGRFLQSIRAAGIKILDPRAFMKGFGVETGEVEDVDPVTVEAKMAGATGEVTEAVDTSAPKTAPGGGGL
jgi:phage gp29-like protein